MVYDDDVEVWKVEHPPQMVHAAPPLCWRNTKRKGVSHD